MNVSDHRKQAAMGSQVLRKVLSVMVLSVVLLGQRLPSVWAHEGHNHVDAGEAEDAAPKSPSAPKSSLAPVVTPEEMSDGTAVENVLGIHPNLIGEGALLLVVGSPFLLHAARRSWA